MTWYKSRLLPPSIPPSSVPSLPSPWGHHSGGGLDKEKEREKERAAAGGGLRIYRIAPHSKHDPQ